MDGLEVERVLQSKLVTIPGGRDKEGRPILLITPPQELTSSQQLLSKALSYSLSVFNGETRNNGLAVVVSAQGKSWRQTRSFVRHMRELLKDETTTLIVARPEAFWDKRVDHCTRLHSNGEPIYIPLSRLNKYIEPSQLPQDLGGSLDYDHEGWIQGRLRVERFFKMNEEVQGELERVCRILTGAKEGANNAARTMTQTSATYNNTCQLANLLISDGRNLLECYGVERIADNIGQDILDTRSRVEKQSTLASSRLTALHQAWFSMHKSISDAKEVSRLEASIRGVTDWILETGEMMINSQIQVGYDISSAEQLRRDHEGIEMQCRDTYGQYAETLHRMDQSAGAGVIIPEDLEAQKDFMDFVCRSFANRLQRRRNTLISSARFFRLVSEYFQATSEVYEKLVMNPDLEKLDAAHITLLQLQESQTKVDELEEEVVREGEKLSDLLSMPVKDALGKELPVDYEVDIVNIRDILEMTRARTELFRDSMELQKITLQQASHVYSYEKDASQAVIWLNDLFKVMMKANMYVGCSVHEIQRQKEDLQAFQDTAKGTFDYGCQLLNAAMSLRQNSKLGDGENSDLSHQLYEAWERFSNVAHNQMTRLRVTAVLHRTLKQQCKELKELTWTAHRVTGCQLRKLLRNREKLLIEVARMLRLARLLKTRLKESLFKDSEEKMSNRSAVDAISERVAEVISLAEQLDEVLTSFHHSELSQAKFSRDLDASPSPDRISPPPIFTSQQEWLRYKDDACRSEEDFQTASECTCTPPSRSSSFYTASDGGSPWWPITQHSQVVEGEVVHEVKETKTIKLSAEGCSIVSERTCTEHQRERGASPSIESPSSSEREQSVRVLNGTPEPWRVFDVDVEPWGRRTPRSDGLRVLEGEEWTKSQEDWRESGSSSWVVSGDLSNSDREECLIESSWNKVDVAIANRNRECSADELNNTPSPSISSGRLTPRGADDSLSPILMADNEPIPSTSSVEAISQYKDWLELKVVEVTPSLTHLAESFEEAEAFRIAHDEVITKIKSKSSPVDELYKRAGELMAKECRPEVYAAMADSLSLVWDSVNSHLEQRKLILKLNSGYFRYADNFEEKCQCIERLCIGELPVEIPEMRETLTRLKELNRDVLVLLSNALAQGNHLLEIISDICEKGTLDSRPAHIKIQAQHAKLCVEKWLESLHLRRREIALLSETRSTQLSQCLALALITADLTLLRRHLVERHESLSADRLGDAHASSQLLLHELRKLMPEAKELQDQALKIVKATEELVGGGHFAGPEATAQAYNLLDMAASYIHQLDSVEALLIRAVEFFNEAQSAFVKLDQLELQLGTGEVGLNEDQLSQLHSTIAKSLEDVTSKPLQLGYNILQDQPGAQGVRTTVEQLENKKIQLSIRCTAHKEESLKANRIYNNFIDKFNQLNVFLSSMEAYLSGMRDLGSDLSYAKDFHQAHKVNSNDLQVKGSELNAVLSLVGPTCEVLDSNRSEKVESLADSLRAAYTHLASQLEIRTRLSGVFMRAHTLASELDREIDGVEKVIELENGDESAGNQAWFQIRQLEAQLNNTVSNFSQDIKTSLLRPGVDSEKAIEILERLVQKLEARRKLLDEKWTKWLDNKAQSVRNRANWERIMAQSNMTVDWISKLECQLYPVLNKDMHSSNKLAAHVEYKINSVLPELKKAQQEIQQRMDTAEALIVKGDVKENEGIPLRLKDLSVRLHAISTEYQILLEKLVTFYSAMSQLDNKIEAVQKSQLTHTVPQDLSVAERNQREFETERNTITEMMNMCLIESGHVINKIRSQEKKSEQDISTIERSVEHLRYEWQKIQNERERSLERDIQRCQFDFDLSQINGSIDQLARKLQESKGRHGESLQSALEAQRSFINFQHTIQLLDDKIHKFIQSGESLLMGAIGLHVERELAALQRKWQQLKQQIVETSNIIDMTIKYFTLVEQAKEWFQEGNHLLVNIIHQSTIIKTVEEVTALLEKINTFLKPGEDRQQQRINEISLLADKLQVLGSYPHVTQVKSENREIMDSFSRVSSELKLLREKLNKTFQPMEVDVVDRQVIDVPIVIESVPPKSTSTVTSEFQSSTVIKKYEIHEEKIISGSQELTPPTKKVKYVEPENKHEAPYFVEPLHSVTLNEGTKLKLTCRLTGYPVPEVMWEKDGLSIETYPDYITRYDNGVCTLTIEETFTEDSAIFTCRAFNSAGSSETSAKVIVKEKVREDEVFPPVFVVPLSDVIVKEGEKLELQCQLDGFPLPTAQWSFKNLCLEADPEFSVTFNNGVAKSIKSAAKLTDQGIYTCTASNPHGTQTSAASVTVKKEEPACEIPKFTKNLERVMARAGQKIKLECEASGFPLPELTWSQDGKPLKVSSDIKVVVEGCRASLLIAEAFPRHAGLYRVTATNPAGSAYTEAQVAVKGRPPEAEDMPANVEPTKPSIHLPLKDLSVFEGKKVRLDCVIVGQPEPEVIWYHNERPVKESADIQLLFHGDRCSLIIKEAFLDDAGHYKVVAINSAGEISSSCTLTVQAVDRSTEGASRQPVTPPPAEKSESLPCFTKLLADTLAIQGDTVTLECSVGGSPLPTVSWFHNNTDLHQSDRIHMTQDADGNCSLRISSVAGDDRGVYTARASNQLGEAKCFSNLTVKSPANIEPQVQPSIQIEDKNVAPCFTELFKDTTVPESASTKFECIVTGKPSPKVRWLFNDCPVSGKDFLVSTSGNRQVLHIPSVTKQLAGKISCVAENEAGKVTCAAKLDISESLTNIIPSLESISSRVHHDSSVFEMKKSVFSHTSTSEFSSSNTQPHFEVQSITSQSEMSAHKIGDQPVSKVESHKLSEFTNIDGVESKHESQMTSKSGDTIKTETVISQPVKMVKTQRKSMPPRFMSPLNGCIVDQGADVTLEATIDGYPTPSVSWSKNGGPLADGIETTWKLNRATLKLFNVSSKDAARYSITASNEAGTAQSTADVVVKKSSFPPVMGRRLQANTAVLGERVSMEIEVTGTPTPTITWTKDDNHVTPTATEFRLISQGNCHKLIIDKAEHCHSGRYSVTASNSAGEAKSTADLLVIEPTQPVSISTSEHVIHSTQDSSRFGDIQIKPIIPAFKDLGKDAVTVSETFSSEKHVSMKVHHSSSGIEPLSTITEPKSAEPLPLFEAPLRQSFSEEEKVDMKETKTSALDFFKSIIKDSEEKKTESAESGISKSWTPAVESSFKQVKKFGRSESIERHDRPFSPEFTLEPGPPPEIGFIPKVSSPKPKDDMMDRVKKLQESYRDLQEFEIPSGGVKMYPIPIRKVIPQPEYVDRVVFPERKKSLQMDYSHKKEIIEDVIIPTKVELPPETVLRLQKSQQESSKQFIDTLPAGPILRPSADIPVRPLSPRPSAEGIGMEKLWSTIQKEQSHKTESFTKEEKSYSSFQSQSSQQSYSQAPQILPSSYHLGRSSPSNEALDMERKWGHKHVDSKLKTVWPPPFNMFDEPLDDSNKASSKTVHTSAFESSSSKSVHYSNEESASLPIIGQKKLEVKNQPSESIIYPADPTIYYVAEAHATHRATTPSSEITKTSQSYLSSLTEQSFSSSSRKELTHSQDRNILPSEARKIWPKGPPITFETRGFSKLDSKYLTKRSNSMQDLNLNDIHIEPGPPPEIGYASPTPRERRQSYVESIEQDLEKDLDKEPSRHLAGAVRIIPVPLKKERSIEKEMVATSFQQKKYQRTNSLDEFTRFPDLEPFPFKVDPIGPKREVKFSTIPRPSKFVQKLYSESDYESEFETKIRARWTPWDSDVDEPYFRSVKPPEARPRRPHSAEPEPIPPSKFDKGPLLSKSFFSTATDKQFYRQESDTRSKPVKIEIQKQYNGFSQKPSSPPKKADSPKMKKRTVFLESGYMADTDEPGRFTKETKMSHQQNSQWRSESMKIEKKMVSSKLEKETEIRQSFPQQLEVVIPTKKPSVPPASPSKFIKGEFRESDYESDYESRIKAVWRPSSAEPKDPTFRPVKPVLKTERREEQKKEKLPTPPTQFDHPPSFDTIRPKFEPVKGPIRPEPIFGIKPGSPPKMDFASPPGAMETSSSMSFSESTANTKRVVSMQKTTRVISFDQSKEVNTKQTFPSKFIAKGDARWASATDSESDSTRKEMSGLEKRAEEMRLQRVEDMRKRFGEKSSSQTLAELKPAEPPIYDYAQPKIPVTASRIANKHISEMSSSFKSKTHEFANNLMKDMKKQDAAKEVKISEEAPQVYREEKRLSEKGAKHIDPDSGLIYFKYDFGYEFGVVTPGPGSHVKAKEVEDSKEGCIEVPVIHETSSPARKILTSGKLPSRPGWTSESEAEDFNKPRITMPRSLSPHSIPSPSISPYASHVQDSSITSSRWTDMSPRNISSSPVVVNSMLHSETPQKAPAFITPLRDIAVVSGQSGRFECIVQGEPCPNIFWSKDGRILEPNLTHEISFRNGVCRLTVLHAFTDDQGYYRCTATNNLGTAETSASLKVSGEARTYLG